MYRIIEGRGTGKTSRLMLLAKENNATFVCANPYAMREKAKRYGITGIDFISYHTYLTSRGCEFSSVVIDELELFLDYAIKINCGRGDLIGYTLSTGD